MKKNKNKVVRFGIALECILLIVLSVWMICHTQNEKNVINIMSKENGDYIKWVDFDVTYEALCKAYQIDVNTYREKHHVNWIELLAYLATKNGGKFPDSVPKEMTAVAKKLCDGETTIEELTKDMKYYAYYLETYQAVLGGYVGEYEIEKENEAGEVSLVKQYGLKAFSPIAKDFPYQDYDDFGSSRSYGYSRPHLGHDMMGQVGTPITIRNRA